MAKALTEMNVDEIKKELKSWSRQTLIDWLCSNDRNGTYRDSESRKEFGNILGKKEAIKIIIEQLGQ